MKKLRKLSLIILQEISWKLALIAVKFTKREGNEGVLLIPAGNLDGGFGEDIMVTSFIKNFAGSGKVTILTQKKIERPDYIKDENVTYEGGFLESKGYLEILKIVKKHSCVYVIGADIMDGTYGRRLTISRLRTLKLANLLGLDHQVSGFSISKKILPDVKQVLTENASFMVIKSRDIESYKRLNSFIPEEKLLLTNDIAFICPDLPETYQDTYYNEYIHWCNMVRSENKKIVAICPNSIQARKSGLENYIRDFSQLLEVFLREGNYAFAFLYHDLRPLCGKETDSTLSSRLSEYFKKKNVSCYYTDKIKNGVQLKGYLSLIDFTLTGRMHFGISGLTYNKPMFGVAYANKFEGMLKLFALDPAYCMVDYDKMEQAEKVVKSFIINYTAIESKISSHIEKVKADTRLNYIPRAD